MEFFFFSSTLTLHDNSVVTYSGILHEMFLYRQDLHDTAPTACLSIHSVRNRVLKLASLSYRVHAVVGSLSSEEILGFTRSGLSTPCCPVNTLRFTVR
jgi:hypothetical protein